MAPELTDPAALTTTLALVEQGHEVFRSFCDAISRVDRLVWLRWKALGQGRDKPWFNMNASISLMGAASCREEL